jgi:glucose-specific phosphotransferase system IIA component
MFGLFKSKKKEAAEAKTEIVSNSRHDFILPIGGRIISITEVEDPVFSEKMMGDGFAIVPEGGSVISPVDGEIVNVFPTKHALGIRSKDGIEVLIHVGIDTVNLNGKGFTALVHDGDHIKKGQELLQFDLDYIKQNATSSVVPVVFTDSTKIHVKKLGTVKQGESDILSFE